jgi:hypothetical protein
MFIKGRLLNFESFSCGILKKRLIMNKRVLRLVVIVGATGILVASFFGYEFCFALLISYGLGFFSHFLTYRYIDRSLLEKKVDRGKLLQLVVMRSICYLLGCSVFLLYQDYGIITCIVFGLTLVPMCIYVDNFFHRKGDLS